MQVYHSPLGGRGYLVPGPGDMPSLKDGTLRILGPVSPEEAVQWSSQVGLFAMRGGEVKHS